MNNIYIGKFDKELTINDMKSWLCLTSKFEGDFDSFWKDWDTIAKDYIRILFEYNNEKYITIDNTQKDIDYFVNNENDIGRNSKSFNYFKCLGSTHFTQEEKIDIYHLFTKQKI